MKRLFYFFLLMASFFPLYSFDPLVVVVLMVKNEAPVIRETLQPFIDAKHQHYLIFDTGSTDATIEITKELFAEHAITHGIILQEPFVDFSTSRNRALDLAEQYFPQACYVLMIDAEGHMVNFQKLLEFCAVNQHRQSSFFVSIVNELCDYFTGRLIRCGTKKRFVGSVHEELEGLQEYAPLDVYFHWKKTDYGIEKSNLRYMRDVSMLLKDYYKDPSNGRTVFYLAQSYSCMHDWENARLWYERRVAMGGWQEELFMASYRLGLIYNVTGNWDKALHQLLAAYATNPRRAEPFICIAQRYKELGNKPLCELFARAALAIPYPPPLTLAVEKDLYTKERYELLKWATEQGAACIDKIGQMDTIIES